MGNWYWIGVFAGLGVALGIAAAAAFAGRRWGLLAPFLAAALGVALGIVLADPEEAAGGGVGGILGAAGALQLVGGALGRGGTRVATGLLVAAGAVVVAALAFVPGLGYVEAVALPALGMRLRRRAESATPGCARSPATSRAEEARPDRHRRPHAGDARGRGREDGRSRAPLPHGARRVPAGGHDLPLADARLPLVARDRRAPRRPPHPSPRLVPPRRGAPRRVRVVVQRDPGGRDDSRHPRRGLQHERGAPLDGRSDGLRGARGRRPCDGSGEHGLLPGPGSARGHGPRSAPAGFRPESVLLLQPVRVGRDRCAARDPHARPRLGRRVRGRSGAGS